MTEFDAFQEEAILASDTQVSAYLTHLERMSGQLKETTNQIETSVVGVCSNFQAIADRVRATIDRTRGVIGNEGSNSQDRRTFERLIDNCGATLVRILETAEAEASVSRRAIERIHRIDLAADKISQALVKLDRIAQESKMLAMNAHIEAAHAGELGAPFAVVAAEVASQSQRSKDVTSEVSEFTTGLRELASSTLQDLLQMVEGDQERLQKCRSDVDESLRDMSATHSEMKKMIAGMTDESAILVSDIGASVRGLQFQDRVSQQIAHVIHDLNVLHARLRADSGAVGFAEMPTFSSFTMREERELAGLTEPESAAGDIELF